MIIRQIEQQEKDNFNTAAKHPLQTWDWGEFREKTGVHVERLGFYDQGKLSQVIQVTFHKIPYSGYTAGYFPKGEMPNDDQLTALKELGKKNNALYIKMEPNIAVPVDSQSGQPAIMQYLLDRGCVPGRPLFSKYTFILDISPTEEVLLEHCKPKTRYNIRLAEKKGVQIVEDSTVQGLEDYLQILKETTKRQAFYAHGPEYFKKMWETLSASGMAHILKAVYEGKTLVVWIVFIHNGVLYYPYGASSSENREVMASNLMMWEAIKFGKKHGCTSFDMWGSLGPNPNPKDPWYGFHKFKEGYGATLTRFIGSFDLVMNKPMYAVFRYFENIRWALLRFKARILR